MRYILDAGGLLNLSSPQIQREEVYKMSLFKRSWKENGKKKVSKNWSIRLRVNGKDVKHSTKTSNRRMAEQIETEMKYDLVRGRFELRDESNKRTFKQMAEKYMTEYAVKKRPMSMSRDRVALLHLMPVFGDMYLSQIEPNLIVTYKHQRYQEGASPVSINYELGFCKHAFNLAIREWNWTHENPFIKVSMEKVDNERLRWLTDEERLKLLDACEGWVRDVVIFALNTGIRRTNIIRLTWKMVDLNRETITLDSTETKNRERLVVPMNTNVKKLLQERSRVRYLNNPYVFTQPDGSPIPRSVLQRHFDMAVDKARIEDFHFHDCRHTFASYLVQKDVSLYTVQKLLGHKDISQTTRYAHLAPKTLEVAVRRLDDSGVGTESGTVEQASESSS